MLSTQLKKYADAMELVENGVEIVNTYLQDADDGLRGHGSDGERPQAHPAHAARLGREQHWRGGHPCADAPFSAGAQALFVEPEAIDEQHRHRRPTQQWPPYRSAEEHRGLPQDPPSPLARRVVVRCGGSGVAYRKTVLFFGFQIAA